MFRRGRPEQLVPEAVAQLNLDDVNFWPERLAGAISKAKNQLTSPGQFETQSRDYFGQTAAEVYARFEKLLRAATRWTSTICSTCPRWHCEWMKS